MTINTFRSYNRQDTFNNRRRNMNAKKPKKKQKKASDADKLGINRTLKRAKKLENEFAAIMASLQGGQQKIVPDKTTNTYEATISFVTDRKLTEDEKRALENAVAVQVEEPSGLDGSKRAEFTTSRVKVNLKLSRKIVRRRKVAK